MELIIRLLLAHILTDFLFQPEEWVNKKKEVGLRSRYFWFHILLTTVVAALFTWEVKWWYVPLIVGSSHALIDWWKSTFENDGPRLFIWDQILHVTIIILCGVIAEGNSMNTEIAISWFLDYTHWLYVIAYLVVIYPSGYLISMSTEHWRKLLAQSSEVEEESLDRAGEWIGRLERVLVLTFVLIGEYSGIGFLIAAKSILRLGTGSNDGRRQSEYVLVGTLLSFALAILIGLLTSKAAMFV